MPYVRFMMFLAIGLSGVCMVMKTLLDTLFADWDVVSDLKYVFHAPAFFRRSFSLFEDHHSEREPQKLATRMDRRERPGVQSSQTKPEPPAEREALLLS